MKTTNTFENNVQTDATVTNKKRSAADKFDALINKCDRFVQKAKLVVSRFFPKQLPAAFDVTVAYVEKIMDACLDLVRGCIRLAVQMSIILIALLMLQNYIKANPAEWAHIVSAGQNALGTIKANFSNGMESLTNTFFFWIK